MTIKVYDTPNFNISLNLSIDCEAEVIELTATFWDKKKGTTEKKRFAANNFSEALAYFKQKEAEALAVKE